MHLSPTLKLGYLSFNITLYNATEAGTSITVLNCIHICVTFDINYKKLH